MTRVRFAASADGKLSERMLRRVRDRSNIPCTCHSCFECTQRELRERERRSRICYAHSGSSPLCLITLLISDLRPLRVNKHTNFHSELRTRDIVRLYRGRENVTGCAPRVRTNAIAASPAAWRRRPFFEVRTREQRHGRKFRFAYYGARRIFLDTRAYVNNTDCAIVFTNIYSCTFDVPSVTVRANEA